MMYRSFNSGLEKVRYPQILREKRAGWKVNMYKPRYSDKTG